MLVKVKKGRSASIVNVDVVMFTKAEKRFSLSIANADVEADQIKGRTNSEMAKIVCGS
jgi:hypothetical protein